MILILSYQDAYFDHFLFKISKKWNDGLFNLGGDCSFSILEVAKTIAMVYEKKYGKYDHEKKHTMDSGKAMHEEGSGMKDEAMKMKEMEHKRMEEGSKM